MVWAGFAAAGPDCLSLYKHFVEEKVFVFHIESVIPTTEFGTNCVTGRYVFFGVWLITCIL